MTFIYNKFTHSNSYFPFAAALPSYFVVAACNSTSSFAVAEVSFGCRFVVASSFGSGCSSSLRCYYFDFAVGGN